VGTEGFQNANIPRGTSSSFSFNVADVLDPLPELLDVPWTSTAPREKSPGFTITA
jgi:hypothetical protein